MIHPSVPSWLVNIRTVFYLLNHPHQLLHLHDHCPDCEVSSVVLHWGEDPSLGSEHTIEGKAGAAEVILRMILSKHIAVLYLSVIWVEK